MYTHCTGHNCAKVTFTSCSLACLRVVTTFLIAQWLKHYLFQNRRGKRQNIKKEIGSTKEYRRVVFCHNYIIVIMVNMKFLQKIQIYTVVIFLHQMYTRFHCATQNWSINLAIDDGDRRLPAKWVFHCMKRLALECSLRDEPVDLIAVPATIIY